MRKIALLKRRYNKVKRRIVLGHDKPGDKALIEELSRALGYNYSSKVEIAQDG